MNNTLTDNMALFNGHGQNPLLFRKRTLTLNLWLGWQRLLSRIKRFAKR